MIKIKSSEGLPNKKLLIISDPLIVGSVQLNFLENVIRKLVDRFSIDIYSSYIDSNSRKALKGVNIVGKQRLFTIYRIYRKLFCNNEGVLWALSWSMEFLFRRNSGDVKKNVMTCHVKWTELRFNIYLTL